jgi:chaperonin cofactor prefoldin
MSLDTTALDDANLYLQVPKHFIFLTKNEMMENIKHRCEFYNSFVFKIFSILKVQ